jgi:HAMP domain-containing protein
MAKSVLGFLLSLIASFIRAPRLILGSLARNLTDQVREIARVTTAVADGDLTRWVTASPGWKC